MKATKQTTITITLTLEEAKYIQCMINDWVDIRLNLDECIQTEPEIEVITKSVRSLNSLLASSIGDSE